MTTQKELLDLVTKHMDNPAVSALRLTITEHTFQADALLSSVRSMASGYMHGVQLREGYTVCRDTSELVTQSAKASAAMAVLAAAYGDLATVLQGLGENISY